MVIASLIIPTFNRTISLNACINSILMSLVDNIEIIIVNDYKEGDVIIYDENKSDIITIVNSPKKGVASARNYGAHIAKSHNLIFIDDDMILNKNAIITAINFLETTTLEVYNADWVYEKHLLDKISKFQFGRYLIENKFTTLKGWNDGQIVWQENKLLESKSITSQFFAIKKIDFNTIGRYNENFPFAGFEDHDLSLKLNNHNIKISIDTRVLIFHNEIDRLEPVKWLERKQRGAKTRKVAFEMGYHDLELRYSRKKDLFYKLMIKTEPLLFFILKLIPNFKITDYLYFKLINILIGTYIYKGYKSIN